MPIYEYQCQSCGVIVENWQKISDPPLETCESCGGKMKKLISQSTFHLKGSGWYVTDYARKGTSSDGSETSKTESKNKNRANSSSKTSSSNNGQ